MPVDIDIECDVIKCTSHEAMTESSLLSFSLL